MTLYICSLSLITAAAHKQASDEFFAGGLNWGGPVFVVELSPDGQLPVTHYGAHAVHTAEFVAMLEAAKASDDPALDALDDVFVYPVESSTPGFADAIAGLNGSTIVADLGSTLQRYYPPDEF